MSDHKIFSMAISRIYSLYVQKAERKSRTEEEVIRIICWLTGYSADELANHVKSEESLAAFFSDSPSFNPNASLIKGVVCGVRVEEVEDPMMRKVRYLDKLIDELARGKALEKILRS